MRRAPLACCAALAAALALPLAVAGAVVAGRGETLWVALHACARVGAASTSLLGLLALALAASALLSGLHELARQARVGGRALRAAQDGGAAPPTTLATLARELGVKRLTLVESAEPIAFCAGLLRPRVVMSTGVCEALETDALRALVAHEAAHARRLDPLCHVLAAASARALWLLPAADALASHGRLRSELAADREAVGRAGQRSLAAALLVMHPSPPGAPAPALARGASLLEARTDALLGLGAPTLRLPGVTLARSLLGAALVAAVGGGLALVPAAAADPLLPMPMGLGATLEMALAVLARLAAVLVLWVWVRAVLGRGVLPRWGAALRLRG